MAVIGINYDDGNKKKLGYESVSLSLMLNDEDILFNTGDFVKDWYDCIKYVIINEIDEPIMHSSSVDHFIMDGAPYDSAHLNTESTPILEYNKKIKGIEFFVKEGTKPTWEELKLICGDIKK